MGMFVTLTYAEGVWSSVEEPEDAVVPDEGPFLVATVHDSDLVMLDYRPGPYGEGEREWGTVFLGFQPRDYFEDETANEDVDLELQAAGLARWAAAVTGRAVDPGDVRPLLAEEHVLEPDDVFVEDTLLRLVVLLGLPVPPDLADRDDLEDLAV